MTLIAWPPPDWWYWAESHPRLVALAEQCGVVDPVVEVELDGLRVTGRMVDAVVDEVRRVFAVIAPTEVVALV
jgi:hypothetical protein